MKEQLNKIADYLLLNSLHLPDIGLFHGKMGIVVALYAYANRYQDELLEEYAWDLFQQVYEGVHTDMAIGLENGLAGIGYGTTMLCAKGWVDCNLNEILADLDAKIMERNLHRMKDYSIRTGIGGIKIYLDLRKKIGGSLLTFDQQYQLSLEEVIANSSLKMLSKNIIDIIYPPSFDIGDYIEKPIGIDMGSAYYIIKDTLV